MAGTPTVLVRQEVSLPLLPRADDELAEMRQGLARNAAQVLGYSRLAEEIEQQARSGSLAEVLAKLGIKPFTHESVRQYKQKKLAATVVTTKEAIVTTIFTLLTTISFVLTVVGSILGVSGEGWELFQTSGVVLLVSLVSASILCCLTKTFRSFNKNLADSGFQWTRRPLSDYPRPVPEFVLSRAIAIKQELPMTGFFVEEFAEADPDPFLVVSFGGSEFYIDVWDEPKFEANPTA